MDEGGVKALDKWFQRRPETRFAVVDLLKRVRPRTSPNRSVYKALEAMQGLSREYGIDILVVHHARKLGPPTSWTKSLAQLPSSVGADSIPSLKRDRGRADAYLHVTGREIEEEAELALRWDFHINEEGEAEF